MYRHIIILESGDRKADMRLLRVSMTTVWPLTSFVYWSYSHHWPQSNWALKSIQGKGNVVKLPGMFESLNQTTKMSAVRKDCWFVDLIFDITLSDINIWTNMRAEMFQTIWKFWMFYSPSLWVNSGKQQCWVTSWPVSTWRFMFECKLGTQSTTVLLLRILLQQCWKVQQETLYKWNILSFWTCIMCFRPAGIYV